MAAVTVYLVRHLRTADNVERRYSDERDLSLLDPPASTPPPQGMQASRVLCSPAKRARETAARWFPQLPVLIEAAFRERHFGRFAGKTAADLADDRQYRVWVDHGFTGPIPGGDDLPAFERRVADAFAAHLTDGLAIVTHAGPIMAILHRFAGRPYFSTAVKPGETLRLACRQDGTIGRWELLT